MPPSDGEKYVIEKWIRVVTHEQIAPDVDIFEEGLLNFSRSDFTFWGFKQIALKLILQDATIMFLNSPLMSLRVDNPRRKLKAIELRINLRNR